MGRMMRNFLGMLLLAGLGSGVGVWLPADVSGQAKPPGSCGTVCELPTGCQFTHESWVCEPDASGEGCQTQFFCEPEGET